MGAARTVCGLLFPFGLAMVVLTGAELFTGNTLITIAVLDGQAAMAGMLRNWVVAYLGNAVGAMLVAAGVLLSLSAKDLTGRVVGAYMPVALFVICGFGHCIANLYYIPAGLFAKAIPAYAALAAESGVDLAVLTWGNLLLKNLLPVTVGNIIGGAGMGILFWYCHGRKEGERSGRGMS